MEFDDYALEERIRLARAFRSSGEKARAGECYREIANCLASRGDALRAIAIVCELLELTPRNNESLLLLARLFARSARTRGDDATRIARPLKKGPRIARPLEPVVVVDEQIINASDLLKVSDLDVDITEDVSIRPDGIESQEEVSTTSSAVFSELLGDAGRPPRTCSPTTHQAPPRRNTGATSRKPPPPPKETFQSQADHLAPLSSNEMTALVEETIGERSLQKNSAPLALANVPFLGKLGKIAFLELLRETTVHVVQPGAYIYREGKKASSFFLVADGTLEIVKRSGSRDEVVARATRGQAVGVFDFFTEQRRTARARAVEESTVLELPGDVLRKLSDARPQTRKAMRDFFAEWLLERFVATTPTFNTLEPSDRTTLASHLKMKNFAVGGRVVAPGTMLNGLFIVLRGDVELLRPAKTASVEVVARLGRGRVFGIVSALAGQPTTITAIARTDATIAELPHKAFAELCARHPAFLRLHETLDHTGLLVQRDLFMDKRGATEASAI